MLEKIKIKNNHQEKRRSLERKKTIAGDVHFNMKSLNEDKNYLGGKKTVSLASEAFIEKLKKGPKARNLSNS